jgi:hypothetical protein
VVEVQGDFKETMPKVPRQKSVFYTTPKNTLSRNNPKQMNLPLRHVPVAPDGDVRIVSN